MPKVTKTITILDKDAPILRETALEVAIKDIDSKKIKTILAKMREALYSQDDGVAIAAPQIGESLRIFMVAGRTLDMIHKKKAESEEEQAIYPDLIFINPEIVRLSKKKRKMEEGCLSIRWLYGEVERSEKITIRAYDEHGKKIEKGSSGLLAQIFQHEIDHLNGILFIDKAENLEDIPPEHDN